MTSTDLHCPLKYTDFVAQYMATTTKARKHLGQTPTRSQTEFPYICQGRP